jgi:uncharacterized protein YwgA
VEQKYNKKKIQNIFWGISTRFCPEKYDFNLYKGLFMKKMTQICQILKKIPNCQKNVPEIYSQIWLNYFLDNCHFGYIRNKIL